MSSYAVLAKQKQAQLLNEISKGGVEPEDAVVQQQYEDFKLGVARQALKVLKELIPAKIVHFNNMMNVNANMGELLHDRDLILEDPVTLLSNMSNQHNQADNLSVSGDASVVPNSKQTSATNLSFPTNKQIMEMKARVCRDALDLIEMVGTVRLWIQLNVPRIEDGNNFGVAIQEEAILELRRVEDSAFNLCDGIVYYASRAKLVSKFLKYPNVADYSQSIQEVDRKEWLNLKSSTIEMRNNYSMLYDLLHKNWEKVVKPRAVDTNRMVM